MAQFPTLYGEAAVGGKTKVWSIRVYDDDGLGCIESSYGFQDGKQQVQKKWISSGKNIGKKNETTPLQQAINEARAKWIEKKESGYIARDVEDSMEVGDEKEIVAGGKGKASDLTVPLPMLAHDYNKRGHDIVFPCFIQPKLDGTRCIGIPGKGMFSRQRKKYPHLEHIQAEIDSFPEGWILDGELYSDTLTFQEIVGLVKKETLTAADRERQKQIQFHVYDMVNDKEFRNRMANLSIYLQRHPMQFMIKVKTQSCASVEELKQKHAEYVSEGYEGIMLRNKTGLYKQTRSADLQKYKEFFDDEYEITGYTEGEGPEEGCVIWVCQTKDGQEFNCRPRGTREERQELFQNGDDYIGQLLTVRFQELTDDGKPRFPVGITIRNYE